MTTARSTTPLLLILGLCTIAACDEPAKPTKPEATPAEKPPSEPPSPAKDPAPPTVAKIPVNASPCTNAFPAYWQDPDPKYAAMWAGQKLTDQPPADWKGPVFALSDAFPTSPVTEDFPWTDAKYDPLFAEDTPTEVRTPLAQDYIWDVMHYIQEGNIDSGDVATDWNMCTNTERNWYHMPFQTYDVLSGREFVHGLTREAPVTFSLAALKDESSDTLATTVWAVGFYNPTAAYTLGKVWKSSEGAAIVPTSSTTFDEGSVVGKLLFNTASAEDLPVLKNMPEWTANISDPSFCKCKTASGKGQCTMAEESEQCPRSTTAWGTVRLLQFDVAVKDSRASETGWVFGTFVADGERKASEANPWNRISPLGLMWGNDTPPAGQSAIDNPPDPRKNGFAQEVIFWDTVDTLNAAGGTVAAQRPGHLGCNARLNGPADNANSSCMSCHMTASVHDDQLRTPPIIAQFGGITSECVLPDADDPTQGVDASGANASVKDDVGFAAMDAIYFANNRCGDPVNMTAQTPSGPKNVLGDAPTYADGSATWIPLDYSLQLSISLVQWSQWQAHSSAAQALLAVKGAKAKPAITFSAALPSR